MNALGERRFARRRLGRAFAAIAVAATLACDLADAASANGDRPSRLWVTDDAWQARRQAVLDSPLAEMVADARRVVAQTADLRPEPTLARLPESRDDTLYRLQALVVCAAFDQDERAAREALAWVEGLADDRRGSDLGRSRSAHHAAIAYAFCAEHWSGEERRRCGAKLYGLAESLARIGRGNPDNPFNNWWGVTHSARGLAMLAAGQTHPDALAEARLEAERVASYLTNYGDQGHYYEGTGYGLYSFSFWGPLLLAWEESLGVDLARHSPGARRIGACLHVLTAPPSDDGAAPARRVFWNDDGDGFPSPAIACLLPAVAPEPQRPWLLAANQRVLGPSNAWGVERGGHGHAMWPLLYAPVEPLDNSYGEGAPLTLYDARTGLAVFRNRWRDADDTIVAAYAKSYHGGGHNHSDAGSLRVLGLGESWLHAGGQAKPDACYQNVPLRNGVQTPAEGPRDRTGKVSYYTAGPRGGSVSIDLGDVYGVPRCRRHVSVRFDPTPGAAAVVAVWDEIIDPDDAAEWAWPLCYADDLSFSHNPEEGFSLRSPDGDKLTAHIGAPTRHAIHDLVGQTSERTFSEGSRQTYPARRYVRVDAERAGERFFVVMLIGEDRPAVRFEGEADDTRAFIGERWVVRLDRSKWYQGPLRVLAAPEQAASYR